MEEMWRAFVKSGSVTDYLKYRALCVADKTDGAKGAEGEGHAKWYQR